MTNPIDVACHFCGATPGDPCFSVGEHPIVEPHMQRLKLACDPAGGDEQYRAARDEYARAVVVVVFGAADEELLARARKDRSIDSRKPWVRRALDARGGGQ